MQPTPRPRARAYPLFYRVARANPNGFDFLCILIRVKIAADLSSFSRCRVYCAMIYIRLV